MPSPIEVILVPTIMILFGVFLKHMGFLRHKDRDLLSKIVLYIALPAMIFLNLKEADISPNMLWLPILGIITGFTLLIIAYIYCRASNYSKRKTWTVWEMQGNPPPCLRPHAKLRDSGLLGPVSLICRKLTGGER